MTLVSTIGIVNIFPCYQKFVFDLLMYVPEASSTKLVKSLLKYCVLEKVSGSVSRKETIKSNIISSSAIDIKISCINFINYIKRLCLSVCLSVSLSFHHYNEQSSDTNLNY